MKEQIINRTTHKGQAISLLIILVKPVSLQSGPGGNETPHDNIFFESRQVVYFSGHGRVGQHFRRFLK